MNGPIPPSAARVMWILARASLRRTFNKVLGNISAMGKKKQPGEAVKRKATPRKAAVSALLLGFFGLMFMFNGLQLSSQIVNRMAMRINDMDRGFGKIPLNDYAYSQLSKTRDSLKQWEAHPDSDEKAAGLRQWRTHLRQIFEYELKQREIDTADQSVRIDEMVRQFETHGPDGFVQRKNHVRDIFFPNPENWPHEHSEIMLLALGLFMVALSLSLLCMTMGSGNQDLAKVEWSLEWLFTFPIPARTLFLARVFEYSFSNPFNWFVFFPFFMVVYAIGGFGWWSIALGIVVGGYAALLSGAMRLVIETLLRTFLPLSSVKNFQALFTVVGLLAFFVVVAGASSPSILRFLVDMAAPLPPALLWNPISVPALLCSSSAFPAAAAMAVYAIAILASAVLCCEWLVRDGLIDSPGVHQGKRGRKNVEFRSAGGLLSGIAGKDLRLLFRDRNFLVQTLFVPMLIIGFNLFLNQDLINRVTKNFHHASALAFGLGAYVLMFSAMGVLAAEGQGLWMLYTFPRAIERVLLEKTLLWTVFALLYASIALIVLAAINPALSIEAVSDTAMALLGVALYSFIASGIGVLATDPLETEVQRKIRPEMIYLYMLLAMLYGYAIYTPSFWVRLAQIILSALLAFALWQKVRDRAPYWLDPVEGAPPNIALADGLIAVLAFFVLQGLMALGMAMTDLPPGAQLFVAFSGAGTLVALFTLFVFWRQKVPNLLATVGIRALPGGSAASAGKCVLYGIFCGGVSALVGAAYIKLIDSIDALRLLKEESLRASPQLNENIAGWIAALAIVAAPLAEEYIFRGLVYRGLRRSIPPVFAILTSAAIFAIVHPPLSVLPVFVMGVAAAYSFERTQLLAAPILTHMLYNAVVVYMN